MIYFPQDETGKSRKLSHPWHGPYRITSRDEPDITATKVYFPDDPSIQVHQTRVQHCPPTLPSGFYWYGTKRPKPGRPSKKLLKHLVPLVVEADLGTLSSSEKPAETGNSIQPGSNDGTFNSNKKYKSSTLLSSNNQVGKLIESQRSLPAATTTCKQRDEKKKQTSKPIIHALIYLEAGTKLARSSGRATLRGE